MYHLCNQYCAGCAQDITEDLIEGGLEPGYPLAACLGIHTAESYLPRVITEISYQGHVTASLCHDCLRELIGPHAKPSHAWKRCSSCGTGVGAHSTAFRVLDVEADAVEEHFVAGTRREMISATAHNGPKGPLGYTVCLDCMGDLATDAADKDVQEDLSLISQVFEYAASRGDWE